MSPYEQALLAHLSEHWLSSARWQRFNEVLDQRTRHLCVVIDNLYRLHNASAVMRNCEAMGVQDLHLIARKDELKHESGIAMGAEHWISVARYEGPSSTGDCIAALRAKGYRLVATSPHAEQSIDELAIDQPTALLFGEEKPGLSDELLAAADAQVRLPMVGFSESYNVSVSVALCLYQLLGELRRSERPWQLKKPERDSLALAWARRSVQHIKDVEGRFEARWSSD